MATRRHKTQKPDRRISVVSVKVYVMGDTSSKKIEDTVRNYLGDFIPDDAPDDPIHIAGFSVSDSNILADNDPVVEMLRAEHGS